MGRSSTFNHVVGPSFAAAPPSAARHRQRRRACSRPAGGTAHAGSPACAACIRMLLRGITYLAGVGALLAAVGVHAARHGGGNR